MDGYSVSQIQIVFNTPNANAYFDDVALWDGGAFVKDVKGKWYGANKTVTLNLGKSYLIYRGLNVSIAVYNTSKTQELKIIFNSVGAKMGNS